MNSLIKDKRKALIKYIDELKDNENKRVVHLGMWNILSVLFFLVAILWGFALDSRVLKIIGIGGSTLSLIVYTARAIIYLFRRDFNNFKNHIASIFLTVAFLIFIILCCC